MDMPDWLITAAEQAAALSGVTSGFVPVVVLVPVGVQPSVDDGDVLYHENGDVEVRPPCAGAKAQGLKVG